MTDPVEKVENEPTEFFPNAPVVTDIRQIQHLMGSLRRPLGGNRNDYVPPYIILERRTSASRKIWLVPLKDFFDSIDPKRMSHLCPSALACS
jgi:hypothetical protein